MLIMHLFYYHPASQPNMEWKPKSQKLKNDSSSTLETFSVLESSTDNAFSSSLVNAIDLTDKLSNANIRGEQHVIIPQHLRVSEAECTKFTFGSFGEGPVSSPGFLSTQQTIGSVEQPEVTTSVRLSPFHPLFTFGNFLISLVYFYSLCCIIAWHFFFCSATVDILFQFPFYLAWMSNV